MYTKYKWKKKLLKITREKLTENQIKNLKKKLKSNLR